MLVYGLKGLACNLRVIYTEPREYAPSKDEYEKYKGHLENAPTLPSYGVHQVVRTPGLASSVMLRHPSLVLAFASFNEQLIRALLSTISPNRLFLVNSEPPRFPWRADATQEIHRKLIEEYPDDNPFDAVGRLARKSSTLDYIETFELLADVYRRQCYYNRIVVAPTGSKMQALGVALFKICCPDVHIEYPTPESFFIEGYSSIEIHRIHHVLFTNFASQIHAAAHSYGLNG